MTAPGSDTSAEERGSRVEAMAAEVHHHHHPIDPNVGVVRAQLPRRALLAGALAAAVTIVAVILLALAIGGTG
jgi:hypothetical protein